MKKCFRFGAAALGVLLATALLARWWLVHPEAIPRLPPRLWIWLGSLYGAESGETLAFALVVSFVIVLVVSILCYLLSRRHTSATSGESGPHSGLHHEQ
jgi:hypothetical protein